MLIEFSVQNFKSLRDKQTLSMVASNYYSENKDVVIGNDIPGLARHSLLPCAVLLGANASGKTTVIQALSVLQHMVLKSFDKQPGAGFFYSPFKLDSETSKSPTKFEIVFAADGVRYEYRLEHTDKKVISETLSAYPKAREQRWFTRRYDSQSKTTECVVPRKYLNVPTELVDMLRDDTLFLSLLIRLNNNALEPVVDWFTNKLTVIDRTQELFQFARRDYSVRLLGGKVGTPVTRKKLIEFIKKADFGILDGETKSMPAPEFPPELESLLPDGSKDKEWETVQFTHQGADENIKFELEEESAGTQKLFEIAGPMLDVLENGRVLLVDELDASLHPLLVQEIVKLFQSDSVNMSEAQLIFTAHNTSVIDNGLLRRDQIWFTKKLFDGSTELYPLSDYKTRKKEAVVDGYLVGRYGAVPAIAHLFDLGKKDADNG